MWSTILLLPTIWTTIVKGVGRLLLKLVHLNVTKTSKLLVRVLNNLLLCVELNSSVDSVIVISVEYLSQQSTVLTFRYNATPNIFHNNYNIVLFNMTVIFIGSKRKHLKFDTFGNWKSVMYFISHYTYYFTTLDLHS